MQPTRSQPARAPGSFSPLPSSNPTIQTTDLPRPRVRRLESASSDDSSPLAVTKSRPSPVSAHSGTPIYASFTQLSNNSSSSLQNFSRPNVASALSPATAAARQAGASSDHSRIGSPMPSSGASTTSSGGFRGHSRKHSQNAGMFDSSMPSTSTSNLSQVSMPPPQPHRELSASQIAAQAAMQHQSQQLHNRQRSQTVPAPGETYDIPQSSNKRGSGGPISPPMLSLTEASMPRDNAFAPQGYHNGLVGNHSSAAQAAASVVFPRSGPTSPQLPPPPPQQQPPPPPPPLPERKPEKSKVKLFGRPGKIGTKGEPKEKPLPSPSKIGHALASLQRGNFSTTSLESSSQSFYTLGNSSAATIRASETPTGEREVKEKEKKHHFLSRNKHKLKDKDDFHLPLSSASSNSRPTNPYAPSSLYNFDLPPSPGPSSTTFKGMSALHLRQKDYTGKKKEDKFDPNESTATLPLEWGGGASSVGSTPAFLHEPLDPAKYGLNGMSYDDAWPYLKAKLLVIFEGEDLRLPVEDFNRVVTMHIQYCIQKRSPNIMMEDLRELLSTGFSSLDQTLRRTPEDRLIPDLVELWLFTFTSILPYMQAVFLPLDLEFSGQGTILTPDQARDFWGGILASDLTSAGPSSSISPTSSVLDVRRIVLTAYRDVVILPRYETLKTIFSRLSLEFLPQSLAGMALASPLPIQTHQSDLGYSTTSLHHHYSTSPGTAGAGDSPAGPFPPLPLPYPLRPGTAMSLDPSLASYNSTGSTLLGEGSGGGRSRGLSNVSFATSTGSDPASSRPFTPSSLNALGGSAFGNMGGGGGSSLREQNVEDSKQVTDMVGRMLQCMSVLASVGVAGEAGGGGGDEGNKMVEELSRLLKLNWLGRGRTGRNRRGMVGGRVRRGGDGGESWGGG